MSVTDVDLLSILADRSLTRAQIGEMTGLSPGTVGNRIGALRRAGHDVPGLHKGHTPGHATREDVAGRDRFLAAFDDPSNAGLSREAVARLAGVTSAAAFNYQRKYRPDRPTPKFAPLSVEERAILDADLVAKVRRRAMYYAREFGVDHDDAESAAMWAAVRATRICVAKGIAREMAGFARKAVIGLRRRNALGDYSRAVRGREPLRPDAVRSRDMGPVEAAIFREELAAIRQSVPEDVDKVHVDCASGACPIEFAK